MDSQFLTAKTSKNADGTAISVIVQYYHIKYTDMEDTWIGDNNWLLGFGLIQPSSDPSQLNIYK